MSSGPLHRLAAPWVCVSADSVRTRPLRSSRPLSVGPIASPNGDDDGQRLKQPTLGPVTSVGCHPPPPSPHGEGEVVRASPYTFRLNDHVSGASIIQGEVQAQHSCRPRPITAKVIDVEDLPKFLKSEGTVLKVLHNHPHPNIAKLRATVKTEKHSFIVMDELHMDLASCVILRGGRLSEFEARGVMKQLVSAVEHCHKHRVVLHDLRLDKICLSDPTSLNVVIADVGGAHAVTTSGPLHVRGNNRGNGRGRGSLHMHASYVCPETVNAKSYDGAAVDSWALGVILYVLLTGTYPFFDRRRTAFEKMMRGSAEVQFPTHVSFTARNLVCQLLDRDPRMRPTAATILADTWMKISVDNRETHASMCLGVPSRSGSRSASRRGSLCEETLLVPESEQVVPTMEADKVETKRGRKRKAEDIVMNLGPALRQRLTLLAEAMNFSNTPMS